MGHEQAVDQFFIQFRKHFLIKEIKSFLGMCIIMTKDMIELTQPKLIDSIIDSFTLPTLIYATPTRGKAIIEDFNDEETLSPEDQHIYRSKVGKLLYAVKLTQPDIVNVVRELAGHMDKASKQVDTAANHVLKYLVDTKDKGITFQHHSGFNKDVLVLTLWEDSNYATSKDRKSISGYLIFLNGNLIHWKLKKQAIVTLASAEAEYVSLTTSVCDLIFCYYILISLGFTVHLPMEIKLDSKGAMLIAKNWTTSGHSKHIDIHLHFIKELHDEGIVDFKLIKGIDNLADILTKNVDDTTFLCHTSKLFAD